MVERRYVDGVVYSPVQRFTRGHRLPWYFRLACWCWGHLWQRRVNLNMECYIGLAPGTNRFRTCVICGTDQPDV